MVWVSRGPRNIGGCTFGIAIDPSADRRLYAVSAAGGTWRLAFDVLDIPEISIEGFFEIEVRDRIYPTTRWRPLTDFAMPFLYQLALGLCENRPSVLYVATGSPNGGWPNQVWRSDNSGSSWTMTSAQDVGRVYRIAVDPDDPDRLFVASASGLFRSITGGASWTQLRMQRTYDVVIDPDDPEIVFAGVEGVGVVRTSGSRFGGLFGPGPIFPLWSTVLPWSRASSPSSNTIRIGLGGGAPESRTVAAKFAEEIFVNRHGGTGGAAAWTSKGKVGGDGQDDWSHCVAIHPTNNNVILAGGQDLYRTVDGGDHWHQVAGYGSASHPDQQYVVFDRQRPNVAYLANDGGVWGSYDSGETWFDLNDGFVTQELFLVGVSGQSAMSDMYHQGLIGTVDTSSKLWKTDEGGGWEFADVHGDPRRHGRFYVFSSKLGLRRLFRLADGTEYGDFNTEVGDFQPSAIDFDLRRMSNTIVVGTADGRIMRALDGDSLTPTWTAEGGVNVSGSTIRGLAFAPSDPGLCWAISESGTVLLKTDVNSNARWRTQGSTTGSVMALAVNSCHTDHLYILRDGGLELSPDGGRTFRAINGSGTSALPNLGLKSVFAHPDDPGILLVGGVGGIYVSTDEGATWDRYDLNLPNAEIKQVFMAGGLLYAGTVGRGLWARRPSPLPWQLTPVADIASLIHP
jgi:photosystem II stability/assembly factor-like uncharacterized protein